MDTGLAVNILSVLVAGLSALYARHSNVKADAAQRTSEAALLHQVLVDVLFEYRSAEMLNAVRSLWEFWRKHQTDLPTAYEATRNQDTNILGGLLPKDRLEYERTTLHFQRRLVSQFYALLAGLYEQGIIPHKILYTYWGEGDLRIIPQVLIPIETSLAKALGTSTSGSSPSLRRMQKLYDDSPKEM
jgi:hypothetical protein